MSISTAIKKKQKKQKNILTNPQKYVILCLAFSTGNRAGVAQLVEQLICNQQVGGSSPSTSSII